MEAGSHSGIARLVQPSLGTSALFPSYVFVTILCIEFSCPSPGTEDLPTTCIACSRVSSFAPLHIFFDMHLRYAFSSVCIDLGYCICWLAFSFGAPSVVCTLECPDSLSVTREILTEPLNAGGDMCTPNFLLPVYPECISSHCCLPRIGECVPCIV
jgi:hypothetical protein